MARDHAATCSLPARRNTYPCRNFFKLLSREIPECRALLALGSVGPGRAVPHIPVRSMAVLVRFIALGRPVVQRRSVSARPAAAASADAADLAEKLGSVAVARCAAALTAGLGRGHLSPRRARPLLRPFALSIHNACLRSPPRWVGNVGRCERAASGPNVMSGFMPHVFEQTGGWGYSLSDGRRLQ